MLKKILLTNFITFFAENLLELKMKGNKISGVKNLCTITKYFTNKNLKISHQITNLF
jgi:hypothetical protein